MDSTEEEVKENKIITIREKNLREEAASDMYEALKKCIDALEKDIDCGTITREAAMDAAYYALSKAEGKTNK